MGCKCLIFEMILKQEKVLDLEMNIYLCKDKPLNINTKYPFK